MTVLKRLTEHGLTLEVKGDRLFVAPSASLDDELREYVREHKAEIVHEIQRNKILRFPDGKAITDQQIAEWLDGIGETDAEARSEWLEQCHTSPSTRTCTSMLIAEHQKLVRFMTPSEK